MADRYWVGGNAQWGGFPFFTTWAATSGGPGGASIPTSADDVFFDAASGAANCQIIAGSVARSINCTGYTGTLSGSAAITISGSITLVAGMTYSHTGTVTLNGSGTITSGGKSFQGLTLNGATYTLGDALTVTVQTNLTLGTLDLNGFTVSTGNFNSSNTNIRSLVFGSANIALTSTVASTIVLNIASATNFTRSGTGGFTRVQSATATIAFGSTAGATSSNAPNFAVTSGASTLTITTGSFFGEFTLTGSTCAVSGSSSFYGNVTLASGGTYTSFNATIVGTSTFSGLGSALNNLTINTPGITVTLGSALTASLITLSAGTFNTSASNFSVTAGAFRATTTGTKVITLNASTITLSSTVLTWDMSGTNITVNAGTSTINMTGAGGTFNGAAKTYNNVAFLNTTDINRITGANTFNNLTFANATDSTATVYFQSGVTNTITGTLSLNAGTTGVARRFVASETTNNTATLSVATLSAMADVDFRDIVVTGAAAPLTGTRIGDRLGNSGVTFTPARTVYWVLPAGGNWDAAAWSTTSGNTGGTTTAVPLAQDTFIFDNAGLSSGNTISLVAGFAGFALPSLNGGTRSNPATINFSSAVNFFAYGNFAITSAVTVTAPASGTSCSICFSKRVGTSVISTAGSILPSGVRFIFDATGTFQLGSALEMSSGIDHNQGTLSLNGFNLTCIGYDPLGSGVIEFGTNSITVTGSGTGSSGPWYAPDISGFTFTGTPLVNIAGSGDVYHGTDAGGSEAKAISFTKIGPNTGAINFRSSHIRNLIFSAAATWTISGATKTIYGNLTLAASTTMGAGAGNAELRFAGTGTQQITMAGKTYDGPVFFSGVGGTYVFQDALTLGSTRALTFSNGTLRLKDGATSTVGSFVTTGTTLKFLQSTTSGVQATISDASGTNTVTYLSLQDSNATGGATFSAASVTNVNAGNNTGWGLPVASSSFFALF